MSDYFISGIRRLADAAGYETTTAIKTVPGGVKNTFIVDTEPTVAEVSAALMAYEFALHEETGDRRSPNLRDRIAAMRAALLAARGAK